MRTVTTLKIWRQVAAFSFFAPICFDRQSVSRKQPAIEVISNCLWSVFKLGHDQHEMEELLTGPLPRLFLDTVNRHELDSVMELGARWEITQNEGAFRLTLAPGIHMTVLFMKRHHREGIRFSFTFNTAGQASETFIALHRQWARFSQHADERNVPELIEKVWGDTLFVMAGRKDDPLFGQGFTETLGTRLQDRVYDPFNNLPRTITALQGERVVVYRDHSELKRDHGAPRDLHGNIVASVGNVALTLLPDGRMGAYVYHNLPPTTEEDEIGDGFDPDDYDTEPRENDGDGWYADEDWGDR